MKRVFLSLYILCFALICLWTCKCVLQLRGEKMEDVQQVMVETIEAATEVPTEAPAEAPTEVPAEVPAAEPTEVVPPAEYVYSFTQEEEELLLKLGMAERGETGCVECIALVMRTVLNRVESPKFASNIRNVIYTQDQFTPAMDGSLRHAVPDDVCREALEMIKQGWDESQGALYYEWCEGESWHSRTLNLLFQHCDVRFYN